VRFLIDAQLPFDLAIVLSQLGHPSQAVRDVGLREAEDEPIWDYAAANGFVIITKDQDFADRVWRTQNGPPVIWLRVGNCTNETLRNRLLPVLSEIITRIESGDRLVEVY